MLSKKSFFLFVIFLMLFTSYANMALAQICDESEGGTSGIVPCGRAQTSVYLFLCGKYVGQYNIPVNTGSVRVTNQGNATAECINQFPDSTYSVYTGRVTTTSLCRCELEHVGILISNIYNWIVVPIAASLAALLIAIGGVLLSISGGNPNLANTAKRILWGALIGISAVLGGWILINTFLAMIGYAPSNPWWSPF